MTCSAAASSARQRDVRSTCVVLGVLLFASVAYGEGLCPDTWTVVKMERGLVTCRASPANAGACGETAVFNESYDRCGWARQCKAVWKDCATPITPHAGVPFVAPTRHDYWRYLRVVDGRASIDERGVTELLSGDRRALQYTQFNGTKLDLYPWYGNHVVYLTPQAGLDKNAMYVLLAYSDRAWEAFRDVTGGTPYANPAYTIHGRATIAIVPQSSCGMGCGQVGGNGIEKTESIWSFKTHGIEAKVRSGEPFELGFLTFYELGRNFVITNQWLVAKHDGTMQSGPLATESFKMLVYPYVTDHIGVPIIASGTLGVHQAGLAQVLTDFQSRSEMTAENTLLIGRRHDGKTPPNDLLCSILHDLAKQYGGYDFARRFYRAVREGDAPETPEDVLDQYFVAASRAAGRDLSDVFAGHYRWHPSAKARERASAP